MSTGPFSVTRRDQIRPTAHEQSITVYFCWLGGETIFFLAQAARSTDFRLAAAANSAADGLAVATRHHYQLTALHTRQHKQLYIKGTNCYSLGNYLSHVYGTLIGKVAVNCWRSK